jgi:hypothetical protein
MRAAKGWQALVLGMAAVVAAPGLAAADGGVRPLQARGARLLDEGLRRSATLSALVAEIRASDVVVYVDLDPDEPGALEGSLRFRVAAGGTRYLRVWLQPRRCDDVLIATLAHELQHAAEVARAVDVTSPAAFKALYASVGRSARADRFETDAAQATGARVRRELEAAVDGR